MTASTSLRPLDAALTYAARGWRVIPIRPGTKRPELDAWQTHATTDPELIRQWWERWPDHGVGIATGEGSGVFVLDVDVADGKGGDETLAELEARYGPLPRTVEAITGSGGRHLFFRHPPGLELNNSAGRLGPGLDIRANGGQVVVSPTFHPDTGARYEWDVEHHPDTVEVAEAPAWLLELLRPAPKVEAGPRGDFSRALLAWDRYNLHPRAGDEVARLLIGAGWREGRPDRHGVRYFTRPGKAAGISATLGKVAPGVVYCFTSSAPPLEAERPYDPADLLCVLAFDGDRKATDRALVEAGWGLPSHSITAEDLEAWVAEKGGGAAPFARPAAPAPTEDLWLPDDFWRARPLLEHVRNAARARYVSPDAVLGALLARVAAITPHRVELPAIVGAPVGLTFFALITGPPSAGKSAAVAVAAGLLPAPPRVLDRLPVGSGEGFIETLFDLETETDPDTGRKRQVKKQARYGAIFHVDEGEALAEMGARKGSTIMETLRSAFTHSTLGQANASTEKRRILQGTDYVYGVTLAIQPRRAGALLGDAAGGTPQRFLWTMATDPRAPFDPPAWPGPLEWEPPLAELETWARMTEQRFGRLPLQVPEEVALEVRAHRHAALTGAATVDEADAHAMLLRLKAAALLGLLDGRPGLSAEDWRLAGVMLETSRAVRCHVAEVLAWEAREAEAAAIGRRVRAERAVVEAHEERVDAAVAEVARLLAVRVHAHAATCAGGCSRSCLRNSLRSSRRPLFDDAVVEAEAAGWVVRTEAGQWIPGDGRPA